MPNMKLLDLQTGKYLELGKDWLYGGVGILVSKIKLDFPLPMYLFNAVKSDYDWLNNAQTQPVNISDIATFETIRDLIQEPLKTLCEKTGAVVYGGRYVLMEFKQYCDEELRKIVDIVTDGLCICDRVWDAWNVGTMSRDDFRQFNDGHCEEDSNGKVDDLKNAINKQYIVVEIFEEYSKQLRNEPNKFEELKEYMKHL